VATAGQAELSMLFDKLTVMADRTMWYKHVVKNVARRNGKTATFMPSRSSGQRLGMHCHQSIWKGEKNVFAGDKYAGLSETALYYIGGLIKHAPALLAITNPGLNSYRRLCRVSKRPSTWPILRATARPPSRARGCLGQSQAHRVPLPDPTTNPTWLLRHADGWCRRRRKQDQARNPLDKDIYALSPEEMKDVPKAPARSIKQSRHSRRICLLAQGRRLHQGRHRHLDRLERGKRDQAVAPAPDQLEFALYFDA